MGQGKPADEKAISNCGQAEPQILLAKKENKVEADAKSNCGSSNSFNLYQITMDIPGFCALSLAFMPHTTYLH